jgi:hypothetical protein
LILWPVRDFGCDRVVWWRVKHDARHAFPWRVLFLGKRRALNKWTSWRGMGDLSYAPFSTPYHKMFDVTFM